MHFHPAAPRPNGFGLMGKSPLRIILPKGEISMSWIRRLLCLDVPNGNPARLSPIGRFMLVLTAPWTVLPWGAVLFVFSVRFLLPAETTRRPEEWLFFQGGTDYGGGTGFSLTALCLLFFGFLAAFHLSLRLRAMDGPLDLRLRLWRTLRVLAPFIGWFLASLLLWGYNFCPPHDCSCEYDAAVLVLSACAVYAASILYIVVLDGTRLPGWGKTLLAPLFPVLWLVMGADGQTPRAGQMLASDEEPLPAVRGFRHGTMLAWRRLCLLPFGVREQRPDPESSSLWYWTIGIREFGEGREASPTARALRLDGALPWVKEPVFVAPVATKDDAPCKFPHFTHPVFQHLCGYMLNVGGRWVPLYSGRMDVPRYGSRDIHLEDGQAYWTISLTREGATSRLLRFEPVCWWEDPATDVDLGAPARVEPQKEPVATQLCFSPDVPYATLTNWIIRLEKNGYHPLHLWQRPGAWP